MRNHSGLIDEVRDQDGEMISTVVLPQLNVARRTASGIINPYEKINQQVIYATSAGTKMSWAYQALIDVFQKAIIDPENSFCIGLDYRIPVMHNLISGSYVKELKMSPSYNELTFAAEYMGLWAGGSEESWFDYEKLTKHRKIKNPEWKPRFASDISTFYLLSVDVGRYNDQTVATVLRVNTSGAKFKTTVAYIEVIGLDSFSKTFDKQTIRIKQLIETYRPREVVIDTNGLGASIADLMIKQQIDDDGKIYPAYGFTNNADYKKIQPKDAPEILYSMKANSTLKPQIHGNVYSRLNGGLVKFLISEQEARTELLATKKGSKMNLLERTKRLMPHVLTTKLLEEMANLRAKRTGMDIVLEPINTNCHDDKYSSFAYGLWRVKELEDENYKKIRKKTFVNGKSLVFFTGEC